MIVIVTLAVPHIYKVKYKHHGISFVAQFDMDFISKEVKNKGFEASIVAS